MPRRTDHEDIAINILDYLFFHDIASMSTFSDAKNIFYPDFLGTLEYINSARSHHGIKAEIYQHFILCGVELLTNYSQPVGELRIRVDCALKELTSEVVKHGFLADEFISDLNGLNNEYQFYDLSKELTYKLVAQCLYFDFDSTSFLVFFKFLNMKILKSDKFRFGKIEQDENKVIEKAFLRSMLFIEFELLKNKYFKERGSFLIYIDKSILEINIRNKKEVNKYLSNISYLLDSKSIFLISFPDCSGLISCWKLLEIFAHGGVTLHRPKFEDNKVDSNEQENYVNDDCSHLASEKMNKYGFTIKARAIYDHSLRFYSFYLLVKVLFEEWSKEKYSLFLPDFNDVLLGKYEMPSNFSEVLEESRNKLRKLK
ncbi:MULTISPECIES: hypothetical protein [unclassified Acinetobacter]|uniref:hypothetical protein n=1 Tax=unclassified Acinetobacter TaxID=196816 RepID=UPI001B67D221|nr:MULTISPECIES: hypothetical protein [unclassified Acinetobacter]MBP6151859.1 hypothetical protein [Candidatus Methylopumilus sp.]MCH7352446.1 hypothetical protein [Acinetobacter sp. NIPH 2023]MCH7359839.1 hypothetical protein [Acinetobacter sp. NIPH 2024]